MQVRAGRRTRKEGRKRFAEVDVWWDGGGWWMDGGWMVDGGRAETNYREWLLWPWPQIRGTEHGSEAQVPSTRGQGEGKSHGDGGPLSAGGNAATRLRRDVLLQMHLELFSALLSISECPPCHAASHCRQHHPGAGQIQGRPKASLSRAELACHPGLFGTPDLFSPSPLLPFSPSPLLVLFSSPSSPPLPTHPPPPGSDI
ncbi:hypothetical protein B7494_g3403 [Chlorociboria aeruginascens]|nr:hypothetical protein B7494_g3403 [Chlorociboria aeruginascens]